MAILNKLKGKIDIRYAVTEIILIAIAILLALAIDQWWQYRADRRAEDDYLTRLDKEFSQNVHMLDFWISRMEEKRGFIEALSGREIDLLLNQDAVDLWHSFNVSSLPCFPPLQTASFTELMSTGRLGLLRDDEVRRGLVGFDARFGLAVEAANRNAPLEYNAILYRRFPPSVAYEAAIVGDAQVADIAAGLTLMIEDQAFPEAAAAEANYAIACIEGLKSFREQAEDLHKSIQRID